MTKPFRTAGIAAAAALAVSALVPAAAQANDTQTTDIGGTIETGSFTVTAENPRKVDNLKTVDVTTCATNVPEGERVRVSWDPWTLTNVDHDQFKAGQYEGGTDATNYPYGDNAAENGENATERYLANGECATGTIGFADDGFTKELVYQNGYGETGVWRLDS
ncbi:hypothetical protein ACQBAR_16500 [Propionibacteriaceae bacterium Y1685]|uniref:hypothetical protein n=1 Tax=Microlunatus sp. Y1700 TaxID=3418487 RepID=UPI003B7FFDBC